jgi:hypothetical protein
MDWLPPGDISHRQPIRTESARRMRFDVWFFSRLILRLMPKIALCQLANALVHRRSGFVQVGPRNVCSLPSGQSVSLTEHGPVVTQGEPRAIGAVDVPAFNVDPALSVKTRKKTFRQADEAEASVA